MVFPKVINERLRYYSDNVYYKMIEADVRNDDWLDLIPKSKSAAVVMEGVSMDLTLGDLSLLISRINNHFNLISLLMDCYTVFAAKASKVKNSINDVGVTSVYGIDDPRIVEISGLIFKAEHEMTPTNLIHQFSGIEKIIFKTVYGGKASKKLYRLYEYNK